MMTAYPILGIIPSGEHRIRDLNDEINKDLREKGYWEDQPLRRR
jgi:non-ribosomal peptide synthetase component E (peptide arylation enzyme)